MKKPLVAAIIGIVLIGLLWHPITIVMTRVAQGPDLVCGIGDGYEIYGWPGYLVYTPPTDVNDDNFERLISDPITEIAINSSWVVGKTNIGWFAVDKSSRAVHYPFKERDELLKNINLNINDLNTIEDISQYEIKSPLKDTILFWTRIVLVALMIILPVLFALVTWGLEKLIRKFRHN